MEAGLFKLTRSCSISFHSQWSMMYILNSWTTGRQAFRLSVPTCNVLLCSEVNQKNKRLLSNKRITLCVGWTALEGERWSESFKRVGREQGKGEKHLFTPVYKHQLFRVRVVVCAIYVTSLGGGGGRCCRGAEVPRHFEGLSHGRTSNGDCRAAKQNFSSGRMIAEFLAWMQQVKSTIYRTFLFYLNLWAPQWFLCVVRVFLDWPVYRPVTDARRVWIHLLIWWPCYCGQGHDGCSVIQCFSTSF